MGNNRQVDYRSPRLLLMDTRGLSNYNTESMNIKLYLTYIWLQSVTVFFEEHDLDIILKPDQITEFKQTKEQNVDRPKNKTSTN